MALAPINFNNEYQSHFINFVVMTNARREFALIAAIADPFVN